MNCFTRTIQAPGFGSAAMPAPANGFGEILQNPGRRLPAQARIGHALPVAQPIAAVLDALPSFDEVALEHGAADVARARRNLRRYIDGDDFVIAGLELGNVLVAIQPPRGFGEPRLFDELVEALQR